MLTKKLVHQLGWRLGGVAQDVMVLVQLYSIILKTMPIKWQLMNKFKKLLISMMNFMEMILMSMILKK
jgi:hypothetical protein